MNLEKVVKYSVPLFVLAIVSRSIEEISFIYYAVPVMCVFYIVLNLQRVKGQNGDPSLPLRMTDSEQVGMTEPKQGGMTDSEQVGMTEPEQSTYQTGRNVMTDNSASSFLLSSESGVEKRSDSLFALLKRMTFILLFTIPSGWFLLTSLWSSYPEVSAGRALYFILISLGSISAGILWIKYSDNNILSFLMPANVVVILIALFSLITNIPSDSWSIGRGYGFGGFFGHQNLLASVVLFTLPSVFVKLLQPVKSDQLSVIRNTKTKISSNYSLLTTHYLTLTAYSLLLTANLLVLTLSYSRTSILSLVIGALVFLILNKNWKVLAYSLATAFVLGAFIYLIPSFNQAVDKILKKDFPEVYSSRLWMWEPSYEAAYEGGIIGLGYGISHPDIRSGEYSDRFDNGRLIREKGNSVLALIEETGVIGLVMFLLPMIYLFIKLPDTRYQIPDVKDISGIRNPEAGILFASLIAFSLHAQFEAWWVGVGSVQLPLFYIYTGLLTGYLKFRVK